MTSLTNSAGALAQTHTYDSFGKRTSSSGSLTNPFQYTGREFDSETNLYYYHARYYDPSVGRFLTEDPSGFSEGPNFYAYVDNDVTKSRDPFGLSPDPPSQPGYANTVSACDQQFQQCKKKAKSKFFKGGGEILVASGIAFGAGEVGCVGLTGPLFTACIVAVEDVQQAITPILTAPFGGDYFGNLADCWDQRTKCLAQPCKK